MCVVQDFSIVAFTCDINTEYNGLIDHLIKMDGGTDVLGNLRFGIDQQVSRNVH